MLIVTFRITCTVSCVGVWKRYLIGPSHTPIPPPLGYIVLVICHVSEVANRVCVMKGELAGLWYIYRSRPIVIISHANVASFSDLCTGSCGSVKAQHGVLLRTCHLSRRNSQCYSLDLYRPGGTAQAAQAMA